ncbi:molybdopterin-binding protein [Nocardioides pantholopis]|uniref:hypothetical protein n=1 Tax=Nocardioides pantholopis TaxID=2483798 RepID=UPI000F0921C4|nr:hypothetical protein [Nocardioides pantholopis]
MSPEPAPAQGTPSPSSTLAHVGSPRCADLVVLRGRAWSAGATISVVELSTDGGETWEETTLTGANETSAGLEWEHPWRPAAAGTYTLLTRARDSAGGIEDPGVTRVEVVAGTVRC